MKKKVKKIPKFNSGGTAYDMLMKTPMPVTSPTFNPVTTNPQSGATAGTIAAGKEWKDFNKTQKANAVSDAIGGSAALWDMASSGQDVSVGTAVKGMATGAQAGAAFGPVGMAVGAGFGLLAGTAGRKNKVNVNDPSEFTSKIARKGSGWLKPFGMSDEEMYRRANMVANANIATRQSEDLKANYYNNLNVPGSINVLAAEGGIMRNPVDALVSPGEIRIDPYTLDYEQYGHSDEKPNSKDNIETVAMEGDIIESHAKHMKMPNGKTPADNSKMILDSNIPEEMKRKMIKKITNWQEANKTKPQEYAMYDEGTDKVKARKKEKVNYVVWNDKFGYFDAEGGFHDMSDVSNPNLPDSAYLGRYEWVDTPIKKKNVGKHTSTELDFNTSRHTRDGVNDKKSESNWRKSPTQEEIDAFYGYDRKKVSETVVKDRSERINNKNRKYLIENENENEMAGTLPEAVVTAPKTNKASSKKDTGKKSSSGKTTATAPQESKLTPEQIAESLRIADIGERHWLRGSVTEPKQSFTSLAKITPEKIKSQGVSNLTPLAGIKPLTDTTGTDNTGYTGSNWKDNLYRMAVLSQPLWNRAEAEPVNYESPVYKYMPTQIDVSSQLRDADQSYALSRYNFANLYPSTGAGMAAGLQAASNRAKQYADIRQWQTNAQNELIGKNVGIYNNWANEHARIMNDVYNKTAANRAAARNINRQNRAAALSNWGTMLSDDKKMNLEAQNNQLKANILKPLIESVYENSDELIPMLAPYTMNRNVKKKSSTR